jgi:hypothetical protein
LQKTNKKRGLRNIDIFLKLNRKGLIPTRDGSPAWGLGEVLTTPLLKERMLRITHVEMLPLETKGNFLTSCKVYWLASQEGLCSME